MHGHVERLHHGVVEQRMALHLKIVKNSVMVLVFVALMGGVTFLVLRLMAADKGVAPEQVAGSISEAMWICGFTGLGVAVIAVVAMVLNAVGAFDVIHARRYVNTVDYLYNELEALDAESREAVRRLSARTPRVRAGVRSRHTRRGGSGFPPRAVAMAAIC